MDLIDALKWRFATKSYTNERVPREKLTAILEAARLAPTSSGLEPFEILVVSNKESKEKIKPIAFNQNQITECSDLLVFAAWDNYTSERINAAFDLVKNQRGSQNDGWEKYRSFPLNRYPIRDQKINFEHAVRQTLIAFAFSMAAAAELKIDTTPMEGFDPVALDEFLGLSKKGLRSVVLLAVGYRNTDADWLAKLAKVRRPFEQVVTYLD